MYVKSLKGYVVKICKVSRRIIVVYMISFLSLSLSQEEHGHLVLLGIFDSVDDTVLVSKIILSVRHQQQQYFIIDF